MLAGRIVLTVADPQRRRTTLAGRALILLAAAAVAAILPLAGASMADPLWVAGVYDGGDYDDLVALSGDASVQKGSAPAILPAVTLGSLPSSRPTRPADTFPRSILPRAPPLG
jgi:hypothetical protein